MASAFRFLPLVVPPFSPFLARGGLATAVLERTLTRVDLRTPPTGSAAGLRGGIWWQVSWVTPKQGKDIEVVKGKEGRVRVALSIHAFEARLKPHHVTYSIQLQNKRIQHPRLFWSPANADRSHMYASQLLNPINSSKTHEHRTPVVHWMNPLLLTFWFSYCGCDSSVRIAGKANAICRTLCQTTLI